MKAINGYSPKVGDRLDKGGRSITVTLMSPGSVVYVLAGREYTKTRAAFVASVAKTLSNGATLNSQITDAAESAAKIVGAA